MLHLVTIGLSLLTFWCYFEGTNGFSIVHPSYQYQRTISQRLRPKSQLFGIAENMFQALSSLAGKKVITEKNIEEKLKVIMASYFLILLILFAIMLFRS
jgi:hypothetical protein